MNERIRSVMFWTALLGASILPATLLSVYIFNRAFPWGDDGGNWLKYTNAILGETYPMWQEGTYQYPPLFFIIVAALYRMLGDALLSIKIAFIAAFALRPITTYPLGKKLFGNRLSGLACAWLTSIAPIFVEMAGWGAYPNLLGLAILPIPIYFTLESMDRPSLKNLTLASASAVAVIMTHHLTSLILLGIFILWAVALLITRQKGDFKVLLPIAVASIMSFLLYRLLLAWPPQFILYNEAAFYSRRFLSGMLLWIFKSQDLLILLYTAIVLSIVTLHTEGRSHKVVSLLISWLLVPIIGSQGYLLGVTMDYPRIFFFIAQPILILAAAPLAFYDKAFLSLTAQSILEELKDLPKHVQGYARGALDPRGAQALKCFLLIALILLSGVASLMNLALGINSVASVDSWYTSSDPYGDQEKLDAIRWLKANTPPESIIVAEKSMARWAEGLAERRVLMHMNPSLLFMQGELEREYAAMSILTSNNGIRNGYFWIQDQAPYGEFAPLVSFYIRGVYESSIYLNETASKISWVCKAPMGNAADTCTEALSNATRIDVQWLHKGSDMVILSAKYLLSTAIVERRVIAYKQKPYLELTFEAQPISDNFKLSSLAISMSHASERSLHSISVIPSDTVKVITDIGVIYFKTNSKIAFPFLFIGKDGVRTMGGWIRIWMDTSPEYPDGLDTYNIMDVIQSQGVGFIILPRISERGFKENITLARLTIPLYQHLLNNNKFDVAYENEKVIILRVS